MSEKVMYASDEAAKKVTLTGWVSRDGRFYGDNEHLARWAGCTHMICECGNEHKQGRTMCESCAQKKRDERYFEMHFKEWEGEPVCIFDDDRYFFSPDDLEDWARDEGIEVSSIKLIICEPHYPHFIEADEMYCDDLPEDMTLSDVAPKLAEAIAKS